VHLLALRRRLSLQPFNRVQDLMPRLGASYIALISQLISAGSRLEHSVGAVRFTIARAAAQMSDEGSMWPDLLASG